MSSLSHAQAKRLMAGHSVQISHPQIMGCGLDFSKLLKSNQRKIHQAYTKAKGVRIQLSPEEIQVQQQSGAGIFGKSFDKALKKVGVKKQVFSAAKTVQPVIKMAGNEGAKALVKAGLPQFAAPLVVATAAADNYTKHPTQYQSKKGLKRLATDTAKDSLADVAKIGLQAAMGKGFSVQGSGFAAQGKGFSLSGGSVPNPYASNNFSMLNPLHPAIVHPLPPKRPDGYKNVN